MLFRFCLYGFLKNQQYYDLFILLAFQEEKHLAYWMIGLLWGFREVCVNLMEIPSGAVADALGRRRAMIVSFLAYIAAFAVFGLSRQVWLLFPAMFLFAVGEAFRTGTHKAMIFDWLTRQGRAHEKTMVYGRTRSWSKIGSAVSVVIAAVLVFTTGRYSWVFLFCIIPYMLNIVNFLTYPKYLDGPRKAQAGIAGVVRTLLGTFASLRSRPLRRLLGESMGFEGAYKVTKDYVQPLMRATALSLPLLLGCSNLQRTAVLIGAVGFVLYLLSSAASRYAHRLVERAGSEQRGARWLWWLDLVVFLGMAGGILAGVPGIAVAGFVCVSILQNLWRPAMVSRIADRTEPALAATVLSVESQAKTLFAAVFAPLLGWSVDLAGAWHANLQFLPVAVLGAAVAAGMLAMRAGRCEPPTAGIE